MEFSGNMQKNKKLLSDIVNGIGKTTLIEALL